MSETSLDHVGSERAADVIGLSAGRALGADPGGRSDDRLNDEVARGLLGRDQRLHLHPQIGVTGAGLVQERGALVWNEVQRRAEHFLDASPARIHGQRRRS